jgi:hypothetical protein
MEKTITNILCTTSKYKIPPDIEKVILNKVLSLNYHNLIEYDNSAFISELSIEFIEQIRIFSDYNDQHNKHYCVLLKNTDLILPVINFMNSDNYIQSVNILETLQSKLNIHFQLQ